ncbi:unnamed protein product [Owenia fusiformis]|uniref:Uncharacterized protein n=1 Tax=Owenia fusiformis TaxID=6347 RepID=A0A8S4Q0D3_OWEFU|nr:unnamed protein product [Owenia fusiformis]
MPSVIWQQNKINTVMRKNIGTTLKRLLPKYYRSRQFHQGSRVNEDVLIPLVTEKKEKEVEYEDLDDGGAHAKKLFNYKLAKTFLIIGSWTVNGLMMGIKFPTIPDLQERVGVKIADLTGAAAMRNVGWIMGCICGGIMFDRLRKTWDLQLAVGFFTQAFSVAFKPWCRSVEALAVLYWMEGASHGIYGLVGNGMMIATWGGNSAAPLQAMHFGFKTGEFIAPLLAYPFLSNTRGGQATVNSSLPVNGTGTEFDSNIEVPYFIVGAAAIVTSLVYLVFYLAPRPIGLTFTNQAKGTSLKDLLHPGSFTRGNVKFGVILMTCMFFYYTFVGTYSSHFHLLQASIATDTLNATKQEASLIVSAARGAQLAGQFIFILIAKYTPMPFVVFTVTHAIAIINVVAIVYSLKSLLNFGIFGCVFDFFFASVWASGMAWAELYMDVTGSAIMIWNTGHGSGNTLIEWGSGYILQNYGANSVMVLNAIFAAITCLVIYATQSFMSYYGKKSREKS